MRRCYNLSGSMAGIFLLLALPARADAPPASQVMGPPAPIAATAPSSSLSHPAPPSILNVEPSSSDDETSTPVLAPAPESRQDSSVGSVTCFACPQGADYYHGAICLNGVACAAEGVTLEQLHIGVGKGDMALTSALRKLEAARAALAKTDKTARNKALSYIDSAVKELKAAGLKAACPVKAAPTPKKH